MKNKDKKGEGVDKDDIIYDDIEDTGASTERIKKLQKKLKACMAERQEYLNGWQRARADNINTKKSEEQRRKELIQFSQENLLIDILPVLDSFDMAFSNKEAWEKIDENWRKGIEHIHTQFLNILKEYHLISYDSLGEYFDPSRHDSVESVIADKKSDNGKIVEVLQYGYVLNEKVIRPAKVKVAEYKH